MLYPEIWNCSTITKNINKPDLKPESNKSIILNSKFNYPTYNSPYFSQGNLSILDLLMFCGEDSLAIILESNSSNFEDLEKFL